MYKLPPVSDQNAVSRNVVEIGTSISMMPFDPDLDGEQSLKPAYQEGHFIPGQARTKNFQQVSPKDPKSMQHVLKQLQPKSGFKFMMPYRRSPQTMQQREMQE